MSEILGALAKTVLRKRELLPLNRFFKQLIPGPKDRVRVGFASLNLGCTKSVPAGGPRRHYCKDASSNIVLSPLGEVTVPDIALHDFIFQNIGSWEGKTAVKCVVTGRKYTYKDLYKHSRTLAAVFQNKFKLSKGDVVAIILLNCPEYPILIFASSFCGIIPTTVNEINTTSEIKSQLTDSKAKLIVTYEKNYNKCVEVTKLMETTIPIVVLKTSPDSQVPEGGIDLFELFDPSTSGTLTPADIKMEDTLILPYSSGTTGKSKGVLLSHKNIVSNLTQISHSDTMILSPTTRFHQDRIFGILPMCHIYGLAIVTLHTLKAGSRLLILPRFNPRLYLTNMVKKKVNILYVVPPIITFLAHENVKARYLKHLQYIINAASPMIVKNAQVVLEKAKHITIGQGYGMTESSPALAHTSIHRVQKLTAIGIPVASTKLKISSLETGEPLPKGQHGEICAMGPQLMKGYLNQPEQTKEAFDRDGWLRTGDIGYYDDDGDFFIVERMKDLIKVKGFQVAPSELEDVLRTHPKIKDAAVIGVKHQELGEVPKAFVVVRDGAVLREEEVQDFLKDKLSSYKQLKGGVRFLDELPKNNIGKVLRKSLRDED